MARGDRERWDARHLHASDHAAPSAWLAALFEGGGQVWAGGPPAPRALDLACGLGDSLLWLAERGFDGTGVDVSPVALAAARARTEARGLAARVTWIEADLDEWDPGADRWDIVSCLRFFLPERMPVFQRAVAPAGLFVTEVLTKAASPRYGTEPGLLTAAFEGWDVLSHHVGGRFEQAVFRRRA